MISLRAGSLVALLTLAALGCKTTASSRAAAIAAANTPVPGAAPVQTVRNDAPYANRPAPLPSIAPVAHQEGLPAPSSPLSPEELSPEEMPLDGVVSREWLVAEIEARNPNLAAMLAAWQAAAQRYPQAVALDDPMFMGLIAPDSIGSDEVSTGYMLDLQQKLPWFGKRRLRGAEAAAEADAAFQDTGDTRLQVRLAAEFAFLEYVLAARLIQLNGENTGIMEQFRETAQVKYRNNLVTQQDVLQADVELAELARRQF
ncbi:MAG TPA: TolC family protein, partial [Pirellulaceae bacterium]|nr:TolC family protein [Pirellulaceae bacterium]